MIFGLDGGILSGIGIISLKYFTVLSNLLMALIALACAVFELRVVRGASTDVPRALHLARFVGVNGITLTFMVVMVFLGPTIGYAAMFIGSNLFLHLIVPLLAIATLVVPQLGRFVPMRFAPMGVLPMAAYAVFYCGNITINGLTSGPYGTDWYGFTMGGTVSLAVVLAIMFVGCLIIAFVLWFASGGRRAAR